MPFFGISFFALPIPNKKRMIKNMAKNNQNKGDLQTPPLLPATPDKPEGGGVTAGAMPPKRVVGAWLVVGMLILFMIGMLYYKPESELKQLKTDN